MPIYAVTNLSGSTESHGEIFSRPAHHRLSPDPEGPRDEGLLHDARNLMGAIGLYCDLLSMPGVLHAEHRQYADELRLLGARSGALIERLLQSALSHPRDSVNLSAGTDWDGEPSNPVQSDETLSRNVAPHQDGSMAKTSDLASSVTSSALPAPVSLCNVVQRCAGLLSRVAGGRVIELNYGEAASIPVSVDEEALERILVNLVRNAAAALRAAAQPDTPEGDAILGDGLGAVLQREADPTADETPGAIRIGIGFLVNRSNDPKPWPIRRMRLTVEDSGCGMTQQQLERILSGTRSPSRGSHGIGFRVVRELVASSGGDLRVMSSPGIGTRVQIEWPFSSSTALEDAESRRMSVSERSEPACLELARPATALLATASGAPGRERRGLTPPQNGMESKGSQKAAPEPEPVALSGPRADSRAGRGRITVC
jgi:signal transduction histidine kinase